MGTKRLKRVKSTRVAVKSNEKTKIVKDYVDTLIGRTVLLKSIPKDIKRAKRLFEVDKLYKVQKPKNNHINTIASVHIKGKDDNIYQVSFYDYTLIPEKK